MQRLFKIYQAACSVPGQKPTKTKPYRSTYCVTENVTGALAERQTAYFHKEEYTMQLFTYETSWILVKMSMIYTNFLTEKCHLFHSMTFNR